MREEKKKVLKNGGEGFMSIKSSTERENKKATLAKKAVQKNAKKTVQD